MSGNSDMDHLQQAGIFCSTTSKYLTKLKIGGGVGSVSDSQSKVPDSIPFRIAVIQIGGSVVFFDDFGATYTVF